MSSLKFPNEARALFGIFVVDSWYCIELHHISFVDPKVPTKSVAAAEEESSGE